MHQNVFYASRRASCFSISFTGSHLCRRGLWRVWRDHEKLGMYKPGLIGAVPEDSEPGEFDIDELAKRLSEEAEKLRQSGASLDTDDLPLPTSPSKENLLQPLGFQASMDEEDALREIGDGGFFASDFELQEQLGQISIQQIERSYDPEDVLPASERVSRAAVIAYVATYISGLPFQDPVYVMLKEYLPGAKAVAYNELQVLKYLTGMPGADRKWSRAKASLSPNPPIAQLLGYFLAGVSEQAEQILQGSSTSSSEGSPRMSSPSYIKEQGGGEGEDTLWVVMKWEGLTPVALYPSAPQRRSGFGMLWGARDSPFRDRVQMLRSICRGALIALGYCHERGVVHGSLGSGSILLSTFEDGEAERLVVKLDNFGFARRILPAGAKDEGAPVLVPPPPLDEDTPLALGQKADMRALAIVLLECLLSALAEDGPSSRTSAESIERLLGEVFQWDLTEFRQYCGDEPTWSTAVAFLDDEGQAGWKLMDALVHGRAPCSELKSSSFCQL